MASYLKQGLSKAWAGDGKWYVRFSSELGLLWWLLKAGVQGREALRRR